MGCSQASTALDSVWLQSPTSGLLLLTWCKNKVWPLLFDLLLFIIMVLLNILPAWKLRLFSVQFETENLRRVFLTTIETFGVRKIFFNKRAVKTFKLKL